MTSRTPMWPIRLRERAVPAAEDRGGDRGRTERPGLRSDRRRDEVAGGVCGVRSHMRMRPSGRNLNEYNVGMWGRAERLSRLSEAVTTL